MRAADLRPPRVRTAGPDDVEAVVVLWVELVEHHRRIDPGYPVLPELRTTLRGEVRRGIRTPTCALLVAEADERAAGFAFAELDAQPHPSAPTSAWIHELFVAPHCRRSGLGRALVEHSMAFFEEQAGGRVAVRVESGNAEGLAFWARVGFEERARILERPVPGTLAGRVPRR